jgi:hypothetical protein
VPDPAGLSGEIGLPNGSADDITCYFSLPIDDYTPGEATKALTTPGTGSYRHMVTSYAEAARTYGAKPTDIEAAVRPVKARGLSVMVNPSRTGFPDYASISYDQRAVQESQGNLSIIRAGERVVILGNIVGSAMGSGWLRCCTATKGFDEVSGLGVPNLVEIATPTAPIPLALSTALGVSFPRTARAGKR